MAQKIYVGLIGYGIVGQGVVKLLKRRNEFIKAKFNIEFIIKTVCDRSIHRKDIKILGNTKLTANHDDILKDPAIEVVVELIGGMDPAKYIVKTALLKKKHVITANKQLIANIGKELFKLAQQKGRHLYFESAVGAGVPIIKTLTEGIAGNKVTSIYAIINGTCNFILSEMTTQKCSFHEALAEAQRRGFAESDPTLDISGMDTTHKLCILTYLSFGKFVKVKEVYTEGITHISHDDIENAENLGLAIKLLAIAKRTEDNLEVRVHPTLIPKDHQLASIKGVYNGIYVKADPLGNVMLTGEGAGQMSAATGVVSDLINMASKTEDASLLANIFSETKKLQIKPFGQIKTKFYLRFMAIDKPGVLSKITGILARYNIGINSVTQKQHGSASTVPVIMLTDYTTERNMRLALKKISLLPLVRSKPVAIRMEKIA